MRVITALVLIIMVLTPSALGEHPAQMGSAFADVYGAFAPLGILHRSYSDFLFYGSDVMIPANLASACEQTGYQLALLHIELLTQTEAQVVDTIPRLTRLRADLAAFCDDIGSCWRQSY